MRLVDVTREYFAADFSQNLNIDRYNEGKKQHSGNIRRVY